MLHKVTDIHSEYTNIISEYIGLGYIVRPYGMHSINSEELCHVDLVNLNDPLKMIRVWMVNTTESLNDDGEFSCSRVETISILVKQYDINLKHDYQTFWMNNGTLISEKKFYMVDHINKMYDTDLDRIKEIIDLRYKRMMSKPSTCTDSKYLSVNDLPKRFTSKMVDRIHENYGCKRAGVDSIKEIKLFKYNDKLSAKVVWSFNNKSGSIMLGAK